MSLFTLIFSFSLKKLLEDFIIFQLCVILVIILKILFIFFYVLYYYNCISKNHVEPVTRVLVYMSKTLEYVINNNNNLIAKKINLSQSRSFIYFTLDVYGCGIAASINGNVNVYCCHFLKLDFL